LGAIWEGRRGVWSGGVEGHRVQGYLVFCVPPTLLDAQFIAWAYKTDELEHCRLFLMSKIRKLDVTDIKPELDETSTALLNNVEIQRAR
jgi:hypothetical protein